MSFLRGIGPSADEPRFEHAEERRAVRSGLLGEGTLACPRCDAPIALGTEPVALPSPLSCPYCGHGGALGEFLSLAPPTRPARVLVRVVRPELRA